MPSISSERYSEKAAVGVSHSDTSSLPEAKNRYNTPTSTLTINNNPASDKQAEDVIVYE